MTSKHDYMAVLVDIQEAHEAYMKRGGVLTKEDQEHHDALCAALRVANALMQEPSEAMCDAATKALTYKTVWNAMRDQLLKECWDV